MSPKWTWAYYAFMLAAWLTCSFMVRLPCDSRVPRARGSFQKPRPMVDRRSALPPDMTLPLPAPFVEWIATARPEAPVASLTSPRQREGDAVAEGWQLSGVPMRAEGNGHRGPGGPAPGALLLTGTREPWTGPWARSAGGWPWDRLPRVPRGRRPLLPHGSSACVRDCARYARLAATPGSLRAVR